MFSGKTSELIRLVDRRRIAGKKCLVIKHINDNRFDNLVNSRPQTNNNNPCNHHITTHSEITYYKCDIVHIDNLFDENLIQRIHQNYQVVGIEEGFFFKRINEFCNTLANNGIEVIVATLESSYKQQLFKEIGELIANSEKVIKLHSVCMRCKKSKASFNIRLVNSNEEILVGGQGEYQSVCRKCLNQFRITNNN